jgi:hypothetical protein
MIPVGPAMEVLTKEIKYPTICLIKSHSGVSYGQNSDDYR